MGDLRCAGAGPGLYPPDADGAGYTYWHRDHPQPNRWPITRARDIKMFVNIFDVEENGGPLSVVPGSHKLPFNPWEIFEKSFKSSLTLDAELHPYQMPCDLDSTPLALFDSRAASLTCICVFQKPRQVRRAGWQCVAVRHELLAHSNAEYVRPAAACIQLQLQIKRWKSR
jgi:hypothetical protein